MKRLSIAVILAVAFASCAHAAIQGQPTGNGWTFDTSYDAERKEVTVQFVIDNLADILLYDGTVNRVFLDPNIGTDDITIGDGAKILGLTMGLDGDPQVNLGFAVVAGNTPTTFVITSAILSFPPISPAEGTATAQVGVTDSNQQGGATCTGLFPGNKIYEAGYNGATVFKDLVSTVTTPFGSNTGSENELPGPPYWKAIGNVSSIQSQFNFTLTAQDYASGTGSFTVRVIPEPASLLALLSGLTGLVGLALRRMSA